MSTIESSKAGTHSAVTRNGWIRNVNSSLEDSDSPAPPCWLTASTRSVAGPLIGETWKPVNVLGNSDEERDFDAVRKDDAVGKERRAICHHVLAAADERDMRRSVMVSAVRTQYSENGVLDEQD